MKSVVWWAKQSLAKSKLGLIYSRLKKKFLKK